MCGICGIFSPQGIAKSECALLNRMCDSLMHRGPDDSGTYTDNNIAMGMRRLSIIDLSGGHQPIANEDEKIWIVFNGEIYNYQEVRTELERHGHHFRTHSDTEVIIHSYEEYGDDCLHHFTGMFAFAIWDKRYQRLFAARDRLGKKPFYYTQLGDRLIFASELKAILRDHSVPGQVDMTALHHYLTLQYVPDPLSIYRGIFKLPPAHSLVYDADGLRIQRYWDISYVPKLKISEREASEELRRLLTRAVKRRLMSDVPLGAFLSGGIDSSIVVGLMAQNSTQPVKTFSIGFTHESFNELPYAKAVSKRWKTDHHEFIVTSERVADVLPKLIESFDEPFADSCALQTYYLSQLTRQHVSVVLNGDGGDETFAGYIRYWLDRYARLYAALPEFITQSLVPMSLGWLREPTDVVIEANWITGLKRLAQVARITPKASIIRWGSFFDEEMKSKLYTKWLRDQLNGQCTVDLLAEDFERAEAHSFLDRTLYVDTVNYLPGNNLVKMDRMTMAHSLEARSPFLDHQYVEFVARLPARLKLRGRRTKYLLCKTFSNLMPAEIQNRPKRGFAAPIETWLRKELRPLVNDTLLSSSAEVRRYFDVRNVTKLIDEHERGLANHGRRIWALLVFEMWCKNARRRK